MHSAKQNLSFFKDQRVITRSEVVIKHPYSTVRPSKKWINYTFKGSGRQCRVVE